MEISLLASGSKGNSIAVRKNGYTILIDAGLSGKELSKRLRQVVIDENSIRALLISHDHSDHIKGAGVVCRKFNIPLFITKSSYNAVKKRLGKIDKLNFFQNGYPFQFNELLIEPFAVPHDSHASSCFRINDMETGRSLAILTDLGYPTRLTIEKIKYVSTLILESNHDMNKLINSSYPWSLKQRIKSKRGHLSNTQAGKLMKRIIHDELENIILAHLSEENNEPELAYKAMEKVLTESKAKCNLLVADQYKPTGIIKV